MRKTLFFINGFGPTDEERAQAESIKGVVVFRNARFDPGEGSLEDCTAVAGCFPARYGAAFPTVGTDEPKAPTQPVALAKPPAQPKAQTPAASAWKPQA